ncbi:MAG: septal ring lytic transglycosylase RlpA family protein [Methylobacteriaceae bacterium]|nr:septal ring lytic transglycosylase RlpA family protein [Methylobacteriaceae bacterium]
MRKRALAFCVVAVAPLIGPAAAGSWSGKASFYDYNGRTASGQRPGTLTAAHRKLPFGTRLKVTNLKNSKSTVVIVSDRGPFVKNRIVDVSRSAAATLGFTDEGVAEVRIETMGTDIAVADALDSDTDLTK